MNSILLEVKKSNKKFDYITKHHTIDIIKKDVVLPNLKFAQFSSKPNSPIKPTLSKQNFEKKINNKANTPMSIALDRKKNYKISIFSGKKIGFQTIKEKGKFDKGFFEASVDYKAFHLDYSKLNFSNFSTEIKLPSYLRPIHHNKDEIYELNLLSKFSKSPQKAPNDNLQNKKIIRSASIAINNHSQSTSKLKKGS